ncbi:hypothetical protein [Ralstonia mannitolilytica]|uniref:hypothetical protein n=1 Tax=Ralstonia mannitolilytica TaxID=105219 RepID=UPI0028F69CA5|nr:hypothetical protein [Ralstonia mannitolilytica]CAJ0740855.1 hypothetical protein R76696_03174 [Ralstonia mannitolilytica]
MEEKIKELQAQVAALQMFAIALIDALPADVAEKAGGEFRNLVIATLRDLNGAGKADAAAHFADAVEYINSRSPVHLDL